MPFSSTERGRAAFSSGGAYRWLLERSWDPGPSVAVARRSSRSLIFCGLNPSKADADQNDSTLRRLRSFAGAWGYQRLIVINLFALVTPSPQMLRRHRRPVGSANDAVINHWLRHWACRPSWDLWLGWGANGSLHGRDCWFLDRLQSLITTRSSRTGDGPFCLGRTHRGHPRHPLYLPASSIPQPWFAAGVSPIRHPVSDVQVCTVSP